MKILHQSLVALCCMTLVAHIGADSSSSTTPSSSSSTCSPNVQGVCSQTSTDAGGNCFRASNGDLTCSYPLADVQNYFAGLNNTIDGSYSKSCKNCTVNITTTGDTNTISQMTLGCECEYSDKTHILGIEVSKHEKNKLASIDLTNYANCLLECREKYGPQQGCIKKCIGNGIENKDGKLEASISNNP